MSGAPSLPEPKAGSYALLLALRTPREIEVGRLGRIVFAAPFYVYAGSAFGPGGLEARIRHHLRPALRPRWHIDHLRRAAEVTAVWYCVDAERLECTFSLSALGLDGATAVPRFGSSDCRCRSHLAALDRLPGLSCFRRLMERARPGGPRIRELSTAGSLAA